MKELKDMTISDVLKTPAFYNNLKVVISDLEKHPQKSRNDGGRTIEAAPDRPFAGTRSF